MGRISCLLALALPLGCTVANPDYLPGAGGPGLEPGQLGSDFSTGGVDGHVGVDLAMVSPPDLRATLGCGDPGDPGNGQGVGKFCDFSSSCTNQPANFCATAFNPNAHFCTMGCQQGSTNCGDGASCLCATGGCGCIPDSCPTAQAKPDMAMGGGCLGGNQSCLGVLSGCCSGLICSGILGRCCADRNAQCDTDHPCCSGNCQGNGTCP